MDEEIPQKMIEDYSQIRDLVERTAKAEIELEKSEKRFEHLKKWIIELQYELKIIPNKISFKCPDCKSISLIDVR